MFNYSDKNKIIFFFLPFIVVVYLYQDIPDLIFGINNKIVIIHYFITNCALLIFFNYRIKSIFDKNNKVKFCKIGWRVLILTSILPCILIINSSKINLSYNFAQIISAICGLAFFCFSFTFKNLERNDVIGIKTKWTLESDEVWEKTHKAGVILWMLGGIVLICNIIVRTQTIFLINVIIGIFLTIIVPVLYSYNLSKK
jgi:hypothetical protein